MFTEHLAFLTFKVASSIAGSLRVLMLLKNKNKGIAIMKILTAQTNSSYPYQGQKLEASVTSPESTSSAPVESFRFSGHTNVKEGLISGVLGVIPLTGAAYNFGAGVQAEFNGNDSAAPPARIGMVSNLIGTAALIGGAFSGNGIAVSAGLGLLGVSGLTAAYVGSL